MFKRQNMLPSKQDKIFIISLVYLEGSISIWSCDSPISDSCSVLDAYTTDFSPRVFSIRSMMPRVMTIMRVARAAMVGSK